MPLVPLTNPGIGFSRDVQIYRYIFFVVDSSLLKEKYYVKLIIF